MSNQVSSFPATPQIPPMHRFGGTVTANSELAIHALGDSYLVEGNGTVRSLPAWPKGPPILLHMIGSPTFVNSAKLNISGGRDFTFSPGDSAWLLPLGDGAWRVLQIVRVDGSGPVVNVAPGGRLTLASGVAEMQTDVAAATALYYAPYSSPFVPIYDGAGVKPFRFTSSDTDSVGLSLSLGSNWAAATIYEAFVTLKNGVPTLVTGPAWTSAAAGASVRGYSLAMFAGILTNAASMTVRDTNSSTFTVGANQATYVGLIFINASGGQIDFKFGSAAAGGGNATTGVWNAYNRIKSAFSVIDTNANWSVSVTSTWQTFDGSSANRMNFFTGLANEPIDASLFCTVAPPSGKSGKIGLGLSSLSSVAPRSVVFAVGGSTGSGQARASVYGVPGNNYIQALQWSDDATTLFATGSPTQEAILLQWWW